MTTTCSRPTTRPGLVMFSLLLAGLAYALAQTMVSPALPAFQQSFHTSAANAAWLLTGFLLSASVATPIVGKLGDLYGKGRVLVAVLLMFGAGSIICALSGTIEVAIAGRVIQGAAGGVFPLSFGIIRDTIPRDKLALAIGSTSAMFGIGGGVGLVLAGVIVDNLSAHWLFAVGLLAVPAAVVAWRVIPPSPERPQTRIDWAGALVLSAGLAALLLGLSKANAWGWGSAGVLGLIGAGTVILVLWVRLQARTREPMVDMRLMRRRTVLLTNLTGALVGFAMFSSFLLIPMFVQAPEATGYGFGATITESGLYLLPSAFVMLFAGPLAGALTGRLGARNTLAIGAVAATASFAWVALLHGSAWEIGVASALLGLGIGFSMSSMANLVVAAVPPTEVGISTGINTIMRTIGGALGSQVAVAIITADTIAGSGLPSESGYTAAFAVAAVVGALALAMTFAIRRPERAPELVPAPQPA